MNGKVLLAAGLMFCLCAAAAAQERRGIISFWGGYTQVGMADVNDNLNNAQNIIGDLGSVTKIENGLSAAVEGIFTVSRRFMIGPRVEYIVPNQGKVSINTPLAGAEVTQELRLVPLLFGGRYMLKEMRDSDADYSNYAVSLGAFAGWGLAYGKTTLTTTASLLPGGSVSNDNNYEGGGFVGDALLGLQVRLTREVSLGIDAGYRFANIPEMSTSGSTGGSGGGLYAPGKAPVTGPSGEKLKFDFSGFFSNIGLNFLF